MNRRADTRQSLIDVFWAEGINKITVREITAKAECNRGTWYEYFFDVYDLLVQIDTVLIPEIDELPPRHASFDQPLNGFMKPYDQNSQYDDVLLGARRGIRPLV